MYVQLLDFVGFDLFLFQLLGLSMLLDESLARLIARYYGLPPR